MNILPLAEQLFYVYFLRKLKLVKLTL